MLKSLPAMYKELCLIPFPEKMTYKFCIFLSYIWPEVKFKQMLYILLFGNLFLLLQVHSSMFSLNVRM